MFRSYSSTISEPSETSTAGRLGGGGGSRAAGQERKQLHAFRMLRGGEPAAAVLAS